MSTDMQEPQDQQPQREEPQLDRVLIAALEQIDATKYPNIELSFLDALHSNDMEVWLGALNHFHQQTAGIREALVSDSRFPGNTVLGFRIGLGGSQGFYPHKADQYLLRRAVQYGSVDKAVQWLLKVLGSTEANGKLILALWGVPVDEVIRLTDEVSIMPLASLPQSDAKRRVSDSGHRANIWTVNALAFAPPTSALVVERKLVPVVLDSNTPKPDDSDLKAKQEVMQEIALVLTLVGPRVSLPLTTWFTFDDPDFEVASPTLSPMTEIVPTRPSDYPKLDAKEAKEVVKSYLDLSTKTRQHIRVAVERINQAQRRVNVGDRAVELATAFEALVGDSDKNEMTHKVKVRTVRLIGGTPEQRQINAALVNKAYSIRSSLVHTGKVDEKSTDTIVGERVPVHAIVDRALMLCVELTKILIRRKEIPKWHEFDILG